MKILRPIESIRKYCLWCMEDSTKEVRLCTIYDCTLYPYRMGKKLDLDSLLEVNPSLTEADLQNVKYLSTVKAIKGRCMQCSTFSIKEIKHCAHTDCELYPYRMGKNPSRKGIGGNKNLNSKKSATQVASF
jgi:hypothetical protein